MRRLNYFFGLTIVVTILNGEVTSGNIKGNSAWKLTLRGRAIFPNGPSTPVEPNGVLEVVLQDISLADAPAVVISKYFGQAIRFPMAFAIKYLPEQIDPSHTYSLQVIIRNQQQELLYINDMHIRAIPTGVDRSTFIDAPVILVKKTISVPEKTQWPELVGQSGDQAVEKIKQETGFTNVVIVLEGSPITTDYSNTRVRVVVDSKGIVSVIPMIA